MLCSCAEGSAQTLGQAGALRFPCTVACTHSPPRGGQRVRSSTGPQPQAPPPTQDLPGQVRPPGLMTAVWPNSSGRTRSGFGGSPSSAKCKRGTPFGLRLASENAPAAAAAAGSRADLQQDRSTCQEAGFCCLTKKVRFPADELKDRTDHLSSDLPEPWPGPALLLHLAGRQPHLVPHCGQARGTRPSTAPAPSNRSTACPSSIGVLGLAVACWRALRTAEEGGRLCHRAEGHLPPWPGASQLSQELLP